MNGYSIKQISNKLNISKDTLRYYDKINLVSPVRGENCYRYYTEDNFMDLMYILVMKYAGFSLADIKRVIHNKNNLSLTTECVSDTLKLLEDKKNQTLMKIDTFHKIIDLIVTSMDILKNKEVNNTTEINCLIRNIHKNINISELREDDINE